MSGHQQATPMRAHPCRALEGKVRVPGDKSISHRALLLGGAAAGRTRVSGLLEGDDVLRTADVMRALGAVVTRTGAGSWTIDGTGVGALLEPTEPLDFGNSGTGVRLAMGLTAGHGLRVCFDGDASLRKRPMGRILTPLISMGARVDESASGDRLPLTLVGPADILPVTYTLPVASAQVKSAVLLAGLTCAGQTCVIEPEATRDHTERMLLHFGADVQTTIMDDGSRQITLAPGTRLTGRDVSVPADPSSAAFPLVAALITSQSSVQLTDVMMNPTRTGLLTTLDEMGASIERRNERDMGGEDVCDLIVNSGSLRGVDVPAERAPSMIDEYPVLAVAAAFAEGKTHMRGLKELRVKESDRLAAVVAGLMANGVTCEAGEDDLVVHGCGAGGVPGGGMVKTHMDHRIAMAFLVMGFGARDGASVDDVAMIDTSFPGFADMMMSLGGRLESPVA